MPTISLCMIVKNEEEVIGRCLSSVRDAVDEIIIVDTGSTDHTKDIVKEFTDNIYDFVWIEDFAAARNYSFSKATCDYVFWLDADDIITPENLQKIVDLKPTLTADTVMMKYNYAFNEQGDCTLTFGRERLLKRSNNCQWIGFIHECIVPYGEIIFTDIEVTHGHKKVFDSDRNLRIFQIHKERNEVFTPRDIFYFARELSNHGFNDEAIEQFRLFLKEPAGSSEDKIQACLQLSYCYLNKHLPVAAIQALFNSFVYDLPRPGTCCAIARIYLLCNDYKKAIYWYKSAIMEPKVYWCFLNPDDCAFHPYLQLAVCYNALNDYGTANKYNELALEIKPHDHAAQKNRDYFQQKISEKL